MAGETPLPQLRAIREQIRRIDSQRKDLEEGRDLLIREAIKLDFSERQVAKDAGLSQSRVHQVVSSR